VKGDWNDRVWELGTYENGGVSGQKIREKDGSR